MLGEKAAVEAVKAVWNFIANRHLVTVHDEEATVIGQTHRTNFMERREYTAAGSSVIQMGRDTHPLVAVVRSLGTTGACTQRYR